MLKKVKSLIPLLILYGFTAYLLLSVVVSDVGLRAEHYVGFIILGVATLSFLFKHPFGYLMLGVILLVGTFAKASFTPIVETISIHFIISISFSWHYLALLILYFIINRSELPIWFAQVFGIKQEE